MSGRRGREVGLAVSHAEGLDDPDHRLAAIVRQAGGPGPRAHPRHRDLDGAWSAAVGDLDEQGTRHRAPERRCARQADAAADGREDRGVLEPRRELEQLAVLGVGRGSFDAQAAGRGAAPQHEVAGLTVAPIDGNSPVAHYELDGSFSDISGRYRHGRTVAGEPTFDAGQIGCGGNASGVAAGSAGSVSDGCTWPSDHRRLPRAAVATRGRRDGGIRPTWGGRVRGPATGDRQRGPATGDRQRGPATPTGDRRPQTATRLRRP